MLKPVRIKKFYLAVQRSYEIKTLEEVGRLGAVQLISERAAIGGNQKILNFMIVS